MITRRLLAALLLLGTYACAQPGRIQGTGEHVAPPQGWLDYCRRHPQDQSCADLKR